MNGPLCAAVVVRGIGEEPDRKRWRRPRQHDNATTFAVEEVYILLTERGVVDEAFVAALEASNPDAKLVWNEREIDAALEVGVVSAIVSGRSGCAEDASDAAIQAWVAGEIADRSPYGAFPKVGGLWAAQNFHAVQIEQIEVALRDVIFHKMTQEDWDIVRNVNLDGYFYVSRAAATHFKAQESGCFVHMTSTSGLIGNFGQANYMAAKLGVAALSKSIAMDMAKFNVRSNCIAPFAFTRMVGTIPANSEENRARLAVVKRMTPEKIAPLAVGLMADSAKDVSGQVFGARNNELILFSQSRPLRTTQTSDGWTPEGVLEVALPAFRPSMYKLDRSSDVFTWDPF